MRGDWQREPLEAIQECCTASVAIDKALGQVIANARAADLTWNEIGRVMGAAEAASSWNEVSSALARNRQEIWVGRSASADHCWYFAVLVP